MLNIGRVISRYHLSSTPSRDTQMFLKAKQHFGIVRVSSKFLFQASQQPALLWRKKNFYYSLPFIVFSITIILYHMAKILQGRKIKNNWIRKKIKLIISRF